MMAAKNIVSKKGRFDVPLFLDRHEMTSDLTPDEVARLHVCDLDIESLYGVRFFTYWYHFRGRTAFCLAEAPSREAMEKVHRESHGYVPTDLIEVDWRTIESFLGRIREPARGEPWEDMSMRTILCTEVDDPTGLSRSLGASALGLFREHDRIALETLQARGGHGVNRSADGIIGCFPSTVAALESALAIQQSSGPLFMLYHRTPVQIRVGITTGEPVFTKLGLFEAALTEASAICAKADPGEILVSTEVRDLCRDKGFDFTDRGQTAVEGADKPISLFKLEGKANSGPSSQSPVDGDLKVANPGGLSPREVEVLQLIAAGKTNQEIADSLFISSNTVATHVRNIFEKTDSANRAEAACYALRHHLA